MAIAGPCLLMSFLLEGVCSAPGSDVFLLPSLPGSCARWCLVGQAALKCKQRAWPNGHGHDSPRRTQHCEIGLTSLLSMSLGNHTFSGSCVAVDVIVNIQKIECFLVFNLRSHLLDGAN
jgi:hypothetical protein